MARQRTKKEWLGLICSVFESFIEGLYIVASLFALFSFYFSTSLLTLVGSTVFWPLALFGLVGLGVFTSLAIYVRVSRNNKQQDTAITQENLNTKLENKLIGKVRNLPVENKEMVEGYLTKKDIKVELNNANPDKSFKVSYLSEKKSTNSAAEKYNWFRQLLSAMKNSISVIKMLATMKTLIKMVPALAMIGGGALTGNLILVSLGFGLGITLLASTAYSLHASQSLQQTTANMSNKNQALSQGLTYIKGMEKHQQRQQEMAEKILVEAASSYQNVKSTNYQSNTATQEKATISAMPATPPKHTVIKELASTASSPLTFNLNIGGNALRKNCANSAKMRETAADAIKSYPYYSQAIGA